MGPEVRRSGGPEVDASVLPPPGACIVVACSGGADSVALLDLLHADGRWPLNAWHLDHGLRPEAADDAAFVARLCAQFGVPCTIERADIAALAGSAGVEAVGRRERYARLAAFARAVGASTVATAHHHDDQAETLLMNILRGAGGAGWRGIHARRPLADGIDLVRPLLHVERTALRDHLLRRGLAWREDASNADQRFRRNHVRALLAQIEGAVPGFAAALCVRGASLAFAHERQHEAAAALVGDDLDCAALHAASPALQREALAHLLRALGQEVDRRRLARLADLAEGADGRAFRCGPWLVRRTAGRLAWSRVAGSVAAP